MRLFERYEKQIDELKAENALLEDMVKRNDVVIKLMNRTIHKMERELIRLGSDMFND